MTVRAVRALHDGLRFFRPGSASSSGQPARGTVVISVDDRDVNELIAALSGYSLRGFTHLKETLEDYFMKYYKEERDFGGALEK